MKKNVNMNTLTGEDKQVKKNNIVLKDKCPSYDFSHAGHMGAKPGLLQHGAEDDHQE